MPQAQHSYCRWYAAKDLSTVCGVDGAPRHARPTEPGGSTGTEPKRFVCDLAVSAGGFTATSTTADGSVDRYVVERNVFGRWWWRGRTDGAGRSFVDGVAPQNAARADYRVVAKAADGTVLDRVDCGLSPGTLRCIVTLTASGYEIRVDTAFLGPDADIVVRRSVATGGPEYWRGRVDVSGDIVPYADGPSPTGSADYAVWARVDRRIVAGADCPADVLARSCVTPVPSARATRFPANPEPEPEIAAAVLALDPVAQQLRVGPDGRVFYLRGLEQRDFLADLRVYDPATGTATTLLETGNFLDLLDILYIDDAGGVYLLFDSNEGISLRRLRPDGSMEDLGSDDGTPDLLWVIGRVADGRVLLRRTETDLNGALVQRLVLRCGIGEPDRRGPARPVDRCELAHHRRRHRVRTLRIW
ncbi:MAG: hypothetical protein R2710_14140 [Acidimicrobiales bacterium]